MTDDDFDLPGDVSLSTLLISVADEVSDESNVLKSEFDTMMPVRLKKLADGDLAAVEEHGVIVTGTGFSDARRIEAAGIGASVEPTKSEKIPKSKF